MAVAGLARVVVMIVGLLVVCQWIGVCVVVGGVLGLLIGMWGKGGSVYTDVCTCGADICGIGEVGWYVR